MSLSRELPKEVWKGNEINCSYEQGTTTQLTSRLGLAGTISGFWLSKQFLAISYYRNVLVPESLVSRNITPSGEGQRGFNSIMCSLLTSSTYYRRNSASTIVQPHPFYLLPVVPWMVSICLYFNVIMGHKQTFLIVFCPSPDAYSKISPASLQDLCRQLPGTTWTEPPLLSALGYHSDTVAPWKPPYPWYTQGKYCTFKSQGH